MAILTRKTKTAYPSIIVEMMGAIGTDDRILGGNPAGEIAQEWIDAGVTPAQASAYIEAGCWDADAVADLVEAGVTPEHLTDDGVHARVVAARNGREVTDGSVAYAHSNHDLTTDAIVAALAE